MDRDDLFLRLGLALAIGFLIGLERGWKERDEKEGQRTAGLRTFSLIALLGGIFRRADQGPEFPSAGLGLRHGEWRACRLLLARRERARMISARRASLP